MTLIKKLSHLLLCVELIPSSSNTVCFALSNSGSTPSFGQAYISKMMDFRRSTPGITEYGQNLYQGM